MKDFAYARPLTVADATRLGMTSRTSYIAGGTELLNWMRLGISEPGNVVDVSRLSELQGIRDEGDSVWIGALTTLTEVLDSNVIQQEMPVLSTACMKAASPQIRNKATMGGNVLQKTRCAYFRAESPIPWPCNKRIPGSGCAALEGSNERHAIFGWTTECAATQPSDPVVALACLDAVVDVQSSRGKRRIPVAELLLSQEEAASRGGGPRIAATLESTLAPGELIVSYRIPRAGAKRSAYVKVRERESYEYAMVAAAATLDVDGDRIRQVRIALGSVAQRPWRLEKAERLLVGQQVGSGVIEEAVGTAMADARPLAKNAFKVRLAGNAAVRAVEQAWRMA